MSLQHQLPMSITPRHPLFSPIPNVTHSIRYDAEGVPVGSHWKLEDDFRPEESEQTMNLRITVVVEKDGTCKVRIASVGLSRFGLRHESVARNLQRILSTWIKESPPLALTTQHL